jgi:hypothetical protein
MNNCLVKIYKVIGINYNRWIKDNIYYNNLKVGRKIIRKKKVKIKC